MHAILEFGQTDIPHLFLGKFLYRLLVGFKRLRTRFQGSNFWISNLRNSCWTSSCGEHMHQQKLQSVLLARINPRIDYCVDLQLHSLDIGCLAKNPGLLGRIEARWNGALILVELHPIVSWLTQHYLPGSCATIVQALSFTRLLSSLSQHCLLSRQIRCAIGSSSCERLSPSH